ncbi:hypothetical protein [Kitasatospora sp. NPDC087314]|uniref:hypothetical protein n=1 Tax=Kitasatospora sp. NPDC087314 TaxID=3364068 RepID=UPI0038118B03
MPTDAGLRLHALAVALRRLKAASGLTYAGLAKRTKARGEPKGASPLSQAAAGHRLPRLSTVLAFARAAADPADPHARRQAEWEIHSLWAATAIQHSAPLAAEQAPSVRRLLEGVRRPLDAARAEKRRPKRTLENLGLELRRARARAGQPSLRALERWSEEAGHRVPRSTANLILTGRVLPTREQLAALLTAVVRSAAGADRGAPSDDLRRLAAIRDSIEAMTRPTPPVRVAGYGCVDGSLDALLERRDRDERILRKIGKLTEDADVEHDEYRLGVAEDTAPWEFMDDEELAAWEQEALEADRAHRSGRDLGAELRALADG